MREFLSLRVAIAIAVSGCSTTEVVGRPPSAADIALINGAAQEGRSIAIRYAFRPIAAPGMPPPIEPLRGRNAPLRINAVDTRGLTLDLKSGQQVTLPLYAVAGLTVRGAGRGRGAAIGATIGGGAMLGLVGIAWVISNAYEAPPRPASDNAQGSQSAGCDAECKGELALATLGGALVGAAIGFLIGTSRRFVFVDAPP
ncbi:MAG TPA: hypothetical protein VGL59_00095 [Polyangia bacterium]|jgi:hypothetical protein